MSKASQLRQKAQTFLKKGKISEAIETYKKLLQVESRNPNLYNELGDIYMKAEDKMQAVASFDKAVDHYEKVALYNNAVAVCKKILRIVPNRLDSIFKLGELKAKQKFNGEASRSFIQYLDLASGDEGGVHPDNIVNKVETILELVPNHDELHARAADALAQAGMRSSAAEVLARLVISAEERGDGELAGSYRGRLDRIAGSLTDKEKVNIEEILGSGAGASEGAGGAEDDLKVEEIDPNAAAVEAGSDPAPQSEKAAASEGAAQTQPETTPAVQTANEAETASGETAKRQITEEPDVTEALEEEDRAEEEYVIPDSPEKAATGTSEEAPEPVREYEIPVEPVAAQPAGRAAPEPPVPAAEDSQPEKEYVIPEPEGDKSEGAAGSADDELSDILEAEDAAKESSDRGTEKLAEEITSDVEENDFRSHYDLGMAYIEMALFNEAIKELQISARSEQLQLRSLEMIGHCFLQLGNPRLAVKQLNRGLDIAMSTGGDNLGIHYNLGLAYEALGESDKAREHYEEVYIVDVTFRDISLKMKQFSTVS